MIAATTFADKKVALFGLGGSGLATARALVAGGADVAVWDDNESSREKAKAAGFDGAFSSDHHHPWAEAQGQSGFTWSWLGAAMARTRRLSFGAISVPGGWRYNPAILAQAVATLGQMFPGRLPWIALGTSPKSP